MKNCKSKSKRNRTSWKASHAALCKRYAYLLANYARVRKAWLELCNNRDVGASLKLVAWTIRAKSDCERAVARMNVEVGLATRRALDAERKVESLVYQLRRAAQKQLDAARGPTAMEMRLHNAMIQIENLTQINRDLTQQIRRLQPNG